MSLLDRAESKRLPAETIEEELALRVPSHEPIDRLFETIVAWGRYAELFGFNSTENELYLDVESSAAVPAKSLAFNALNSSHGPQTGFCGCFAASRKYARQRLNTG